MLKLNVCWQKSGARSSSAAAGEGRVKLMALVSMTRYDQYVTMYTVTIADLKSRLSEHLRKVRAGRSMTILDRNHPVARLVPIEKTGTSLTVRPPLASAPKLQRVPLPPPLRLRKDILAFLNEERQGER